MATLYNQYIYKNGAWMKIGTSSDSVTYALSYSALTGLLTLTGSDGSTSTVTIESGSSDAITGITVNGTTVTVTDGVAAISIPTNVSAFTNDAGYITTPAFKITVTENNGTYTADKTYAEISQAINNGYICYVTDGTYNYYYTFAIEGYFYFEHNTSWANDYFSISSDSVLYDSENQFGTAAQNMVFATPPDQNGIPYFRALVANDIPDLSGTYLTSYTETDPVFSASAAAGITATDISNWNNKVSDDKTWNGIELVKTVSSLSNTQAIVPFLWNINETTARYATVSKIPAYDCIAQYSNGYLNSTTPSSDDSSTKVATTSFVKTALGALDTDIGELRTDIATAQTDIFALDSHKSNAGQDIYIGASLDDCTTAGWYYIDPSTTTVNIPDASGGFLEVIRTSSNDAGAVLQRFTAVNDGITYTRYDANATGSFTEWHKMG